MKLSISIVNWNTKGLLNQCLESIYKSSFKDFDVFVVDNNSADGSAEMVKNLFPEVNLLSNTKNLGFAKGNNQAIRLSKGRYILILNPDIILYENTLEQMLSFMDTHPGAGAIGIKLMEADSTETKKGYFRRFPSIIQTILFYTMLDKVCLKNRRLTDKYWERLDTSGIMEIDQVPGACLFVRKEMLEEIGLFDERFELFFEDVDLCYRIKKANWKLIYVPSIQAVHIGAQSIGKLPYSELATKFFRSMYLYSEKHHSQIKAEIMKHIVLCNTLLKILITQSLYYLSNYKKEKRAEHIHMLWQLAKNLWRM